MKSSIKLEAFWSREVPPEIDRFVERNFAIVDRVAEVLKERGWTHYELARRLGQDPTEVSEWMTGLQDLSLLAVAKMEEALGLDLLAVVSTKKKK